MYRRVSTTQMCEIFFIRKRCVQNAIIERLVKRVNRKIGVCPSDETGGERKRVNYHGCITMEVSHNRNSSAVTNLYLYYYRSAVHKRLSSQICPQNLNDSARPSAIRHRLSPRLLCAYILPIRDLWTAFCVLLAFVFYIKK